MVLKFPKQVPLASGDVTSTVQARDDLGNRRLTGGDEFVVELRGPSSAYASITDGGDGTYAAALSTNVAGDHLVHVTLGTHALSGAEWLKEQHALPGLPMSYEKTPVSCCVTCTASNHLR